MKKIILSILILLLILSVWYGVIMSEEKGWCECMDKQEGIDTYFKWFGGCQFKSNPLELFIPYDV